MTTADDLSRLFRVHPESTMIVAFGSDAALSHEKHHSEVAVTAQLLDPDEKTPSGKWLLLYLLPVQALVLMGAIYSHAKEQGWPIPPNLLEEMTTTQLSPDTKKH